MFNHVFYLGGETAEMPDMYAAGEYDVAGFAVGAVERENLLPKKDAIKEGDVVIGLPSSGVHSNGFSLVRKVVKISGVKYTDKAIFSQNGLSYGEEFLKPTRIYVKAVLRAIKTGKVKGFAHITGGGLVENIPRVLSKGLNVVLDAKTWNIPPIFGWLAAFGGVNEPELLRTFNCGIGAILIAEKQHETELLELLKDEKAVSIGTVSKGDEVIVNNFSEAIEVTMKPLLPDLLRKSAEPKKRVGVLISGSGTNLQALIDATLDPTQRIGAEIVIVVSNKADVEGLKRAERANIPTQVSGIISCFL